MDIKQELNRMAEMVVPGMAELRYAIAKLQTSATLSRFTDTERKKEETAVLKPVVEKILGSLRNCLAAERSKIDMIEGQMKRFCEPPKDEFSPENLKELRDNLKELPAEDRLDRIKAGLNGRSAFFYATVSDPGEELPGLDDLRREFIKGKNPELLAKEMDAKNSYALHVALANQLSGIASKLVDDAGFVFPLKLGERWISRPANQAEEMARAYVESTNRSKIQGLEPESD